MTEHTGEVEDQFCDTLKACHCACPSQAMGEMRWALEAVQSRGRIDVPMLVLYYLDSAGLIEHGTSLTSAWLTTKGEQLLSWLRSQKAEALPVTCAPKEAE